MISNKLKRLSKKTIKILKGIVYLCVAILLIHSFLFIAVQFNWINDNYYLSVMLLPVILVVVGVCAMILPYLNQNGSYQTTTKNDNIMIYVGGFLIVLAIIAFVLGTISYNSNI